MKIEIKNIRSIAAASIEAAGITMICGNNMSGKTTIIRSVAAALLGNAKIYGATKTNASGVISAGMVEAESIVSGDGWVAGVRWPSCDVVGSGNPPPANAITMGMIRPASDFDKNQWAEFIRSIADTGNGDDADKLEELLLETGAKQDFVLSVVKNARTIGFDALSREARSKAADAKRDWERSTGERYGLSKAEGWKAEGWKDIDLKANAERLVKLEDELRSSGTEMLGKDQIEAEIDLLVGKSNKLTQRLEIITADLRRTRHELNMYPSTAPLVCPCCGEKLEINNGKLEPFKRKPNEFGSKRHNELLENIEKFTEAERNLSTEKAATVSRLDVMRQTVKRIVGLDKTPREKDEIKAEIESIEATMDAFRRTEAASASHKRVAFWTKVHELTSPTGLRLERTIEAAKKLNVDIDRIGKKIFPSSTVKLVVDETGIDVRINGRGYRAMVDKGDPNSYALCIDILFQIVAARALGNGAPILVDRLDTLMKQSLNCVMRAMHEEGLTVIAARSMPERPSVDILARKNIGSIWWIDNGKVEPIDGSVA